MGSSPSAQRYPALDGHRARCTNGSLQRFGYFLDASFFPRHSFQRAMVFLRPCATNNSLFLAMLAPIVGAGLYRGKVSLQRVAVVDHKRRGFGWQKLG
jgi:hypothetical protein